MAKKKMKSQVKVLKRSMIVYKKGGNYGECIIKLRIPKGATVVIPEESCYRGASKKLRTNRAEVLGITEGRTKINECRCYVQSIWGIFYTVGKTVRAAVSKNLREVCAPGIHFFMTRREAVRYQS